MRHVIRDEILNFSFFGLITTKEPKCLEGYLCMESIVDESHLLCVHLLDEYATEANVWIVNL